MSTPIFTKPIIPMTIINVITTYMLVHQHSPMIKVMKDLSALGYSNNEIKAGFNAYLDW